MLISMNEFLMSLSFALDFVEMDILGRTSNHGKRVAYIAYGISKQLDFTKEEISDLVALALLHDNGVCEYSLHKKMESDKAPNMKDIENSKEHCTIGEENIKAYPFFTQVKNVIKYHHETYNGEGFFKLKAEEIPLMSQIIHLADLIEINFDLGNNNYDTQREIKEFVTENENVKFSSTIVDAFINVSNRKYFWMDLNNNFINMAVKKIIPEYYLELPLEQIYNITKVFSKIIDSKSKFTQRHSADLAEKISIMAGFYNLNLDERTKLIIAANLHDIGKLAVPNSILDNPGKLDKNEFERIKEHTYYTRIALQDIKEFEQITEWASNHHETLNGTGYPYGFDSEYLDFNSRLMACLDIYQALTEERPYRIALIHSEAMKILYGMKDAGLIDGVIVNDIEKVFK